METILILTLAAGMALCVALAITAFVLVRIHFGRYVRRAHRDLWATLVPPGSWLMHPGYGFDATEAMRRFRVGDEDLRDPELIRRRRLANAAERVSNLAWVGLIVGSLVLLGVLAALHSSRAS